MKLLRIGPSGSEAPAILDTDGIARDVSSIVSDFGPETISPALHERLAAADLTQLPALPADARIGAPVSRVGHFIAVGLNYVDHAAESSQPAPTEPIIFSKAPNSLSGPNDPVVLPKGSVKGDWEAELAFVIGRRCDYVAEDDALSHVFGYAVCNDVSEREYQFRPGGQWLKGKSAPTFGPLGPWLVTADEIPDPQSLHIFLDLNGERVQDGNTAKMIFSVAHLISYISRFMVLEPGDVVTTGTPHGVGMGRTPQVFLKAGDTMRLGIAGLGEQQQVVKQRT